MMPFCMEHGMHAWVRARHASGRSCRRHSKQECIGSGIQAFWGHQQLAFDCADELQLPASSSCKGRNAVTGRQQTVRQERSGS